MKNILDTEARTWVDSSTGITHTITPTWEAPLYSTLGFTLFGFLGVIAYVLLRGTRNIEWVLFGWLVFASLPFGIFAILQTTRIVGRHNYWRVLESAERLTGYDLNNDGIIGKPVPTAEYSQYERTVLYWLQGGSTLRDDTREAIGIDDKQWRQYRDSALRIAVPEGEPPIFIKVERQGKGFGLMPHHYWKARWQEVRQLL